MRSKLIFNLTTVSPLLGLILMVTMCVPSAWGQADQDTLLPDLAPREMEILGDLEITFPSLQRQPLTGFNPPPRVFEVPRGWRPWTEDYKQPSADLPGTSLIQPASPPTTVSVGQHPHNGELSMGIGTYLSREVSARATFDLGDKLVVFGDVFHEGLDEFEPFGDSLGTKAPSQQYHGLAGFTYRSGSLAAGVELGGFFQEFDVYGARSDSSADIPVRDGQGLEGRVWIRSASKSALPFELSATLHNDTYETIRDDLSESLSVESGQVKLEGNTTLSFIGNETTLDAKVWANSQTGGVIPEGLESRASRSNDLTAYQTGGELKIETGPNGILRVGAEIHGYSLSGGALGTPLGATDRSKFYVAPRMSYVNRVGSGAEVYLKNSPIVSLPNHRQLFDINPFLVDGQLLLPEMSIVNVEGGVIFYKGPLRVAGRSGITTYENFRYFTSGRSATFGDGFFNAQYGMADVLFAGADVGITFPGQFSATLTGRVQSAKLEDDVDVPNYPGFIAGLRASYVFAGDRALLQVDGKFVGDRNVDAVTDEVVSGYIDLAFVGSYYLKNGIGFFGRIQSISGSSFERWVGYPVADWVTLGGIRLRW